MGYDHYLIHLLPHRATTTNPGDVLPQGMTHPYGTPCPFANRGFLRRSASAPCCALYTWTASELEEWGALDVSQRMQSDMGADEALQFATALREAADRLQQNPYLAGQLAEAAPLLEEVYCDEFNLMGRHFWEGPIAGARKVAEWYEQVGRLGFGVKVDHP